VASSAPLSGSPPECPAGFKWCPDCQKKLPQVWFKGPRCTKCAAKKGRNQRLLAKFGLTTEEYDFLLTHQGGRCAICQTEPKKTKYAVDHDHKTGRIRGILCLICNHKLLGGAREKIALLKRAIEYLEHPPAFVVLGVRLVPSKLPGSKIA
jgi:DNA-directed RNA polymerase subunit RPC12/RpoP